MKGEATSSQVSPRSSASPTPAFRAKVSARYIWGERALAASASIRMQALVGQDAPFDHGCEQIKVLAGLEVTVKSVERTAEAIREDIARREREQIQHSLLLFCGVCLADIVPHLELELLLFLQPHPHEVAKITHDAEQEANLFIHSFGRRTFGEAVVLILDEGCLVHVNEHFVPNQALNVADCILREGCGLRKSQLVFLKELVCDLADGADPFASNVGEVVEALLKFTATILSAVLARVFDSDLLDSRMRRRQTRIRTTKYRLAGRDS